MDFFYLSNYVGGFTPGHSVELASSYAFNKAVSVSAGYTFMKGSETMELLNKVSEKRQLHWAWLMLTVSPRLFTTTWQDKQ